MSYAEESPRTAGQFASHKFDLFSLKIGSDKGSTHFLSARTFHQMEKYNFLMEWDECLSPHSFWKDCSTSFPTRTTVYFIKRQGGSECPNIPVKAGKVEHLWWFIFCPKVENPVWLTHVKGGICVGKFKLDSWRRSIREWHEFYLTLKRYHLKLNRIDYRPLVWKQASANFVFWSSLVLLIIICFLRSFRYL